MDVCDTLGCGEWVGGPGVNEAGNGAGHETSWERYSWKTGQHTLLWIIFSVFLFDHLIYLQNTLRTDLIQMEIRIPQWLTDLIKYTFR